jgi:hypothetical protein
MSLQQQVLSGIGSVHSLLMTYALSPTGQAQIQGRRIANERAAEKPDGRAEEARNLRRENRAEETPQNQSKEEMLYSFAQSQLNDPKTGLNYELAELKKAQKLSPTGERAARIKEITDERKNYNSLSKMMQKRIKEAGKK